MNFKVKILTLNTSTIMIKRTENGESRTRVITRGGRSRLKVMRLTTITTHDYNIKYQILVKKK